MSTWQSAVYRKPSMSTIKILGHEIDAELGWWGAGEYIAVEPIENVVSKSKFVLQAWVYGNSLENSLVHPKP